MAEQIIISVVPDAEGPVVIQVNYGVRFTWDVDAARKLREDLITAFAENSSSDRKSCVVELTAQTVSSSIVRALWDLYLAVNDKAGRLAVVGYPYQYVDSLLSLGFLELDGFSLEVGLEEAIARVR